MGIHIIHFNIYICTYITWSLHSRCCLRDESLELNTGIKSSVSTPKILANVTLLLVRFKWTKNVCWKTFSCHGIIKLPIKWRHIEHDGVSNHQPDDCLLNRLFNAQIKENITAPRHWPLCGEFTGDRGIPRKKGPVTLHFFYLMTSPCTVCRGLWVLQGDRVCRSMHQGI